MCRIYQHLIFTCGCRIDQSSVPLYIDFCTLPPRVPRLPRHKGLGKGLKSPVCPSCTPNLTIDLRRDIPIQPFNPLRILCLEHHIAIANGDDPREIEPISYPCFHAVTRKLHDFQKSADLERLVKGMGWRLVEREWTHSKMDLRHVCPVEQGILIVDEEAEDASDAGPGEEDEEQLAT